MRALTFIVSIHGEVKNLMLSLQNVRSFLLLLETTGDRLRSPQNFHNENIKVQLKHKVGLQFVGEEETPILCGWEL